MRADTGGTRTGMTRTKRIVLTALVAVVLLALLRLALPMALAEWHYRTSPTFAEYLAANPVAHPLRRSLWPVDSPFATGPDWQRGDIDPFALADDDPDFERIMFEQQVEIQRGHEVLLRFHRQIAAAVHRGTGRQHGLAVRVTLQQSHPEMRVQTRIRFSDPDEVFSPHHRTESAIAFETFLLAGAGEPIHEAIQSNVDDPPSPPRLGTGWWRVLTGIAHPVGPLAEEGLIHTVRQGVQAGWLEQQPDSGSSIGIAWPFHTVNTQRYSYTVNAKISADTMRSSAQFQREYRRSGQVW